MKSLCAWIALIILSLPFLVAAQEVPVSPTPAATPELHFAPGIQVMNVDYGMPYPLSPFNVSRYVRLDNVSRTVQILNQFTNVWDTFPYSDQIEMLDTVFVRSDDKLIFNQPFVDPRGFYPTLPDKPIWILDPKTGVFSQVETVCGGYAKALPEDESWVIYTDSRVNRSSLCSTATGELAMLVRDTKWDVVDSTDAWLVVSHEQAMQSRSWPVDIYSLERATGKLTHLGTIEHYQKIAVEKWITGTRGLLLDSGECEGCVENLYHFDATVPDSLTYLMEGRADFFTSPDRYEYLYTYWEHAEHIGYAWDPVCGAEIYDLDTETFSDLSFGKDCFGSVLRRGDDYLYVSYGATGRTLYSLNIKTGKERALYSDNKLLLINSISPNGHYAVLVMNGGNYQPPPRGEMTDEYYDPERYRPSSYLGASDISDNSHILIYDLDHDSVLAEIQVNDRVANWFGDASFYLTDPNWGVKDLELVKLSEMGVEHVDIPLDDNYYDIAASPDTNSLTLTNNQAVVVFSLSERRFIPILHLSEPAEWRISASWVGEDRMEIYAGPFSGAETGPTYTVRIPQ